jgi:hypothetical protein
VLSIAERQQLQGCARSRALPHALVRRARIVPLPASGHSNSAVAEALDLAKPTVGLWRDRFLEAGVAGLYGEAHAGRPRTRNDVDVARLMRQALTTRPKTTTHWSVRTFAAAMGVSKSTVARDFVLFGVQSHRSRSFKLSNDSFFVEKVRDIVGGCN